MNAIHIDSPQTGLQFSPRMRRWTLGTALAVALLGLYSIGVTWFAQQLQADMQKSYQIAPILNDHALGESVAFSDSAQLSP